MEVLPEPLIVPYLIDADEDKFNASTMSDTLSTSRDEYVTI